MRTPSLTAFVNPFIVSVFICTAMSGYAEAQSAVDRIAYTQCGPDLDTWGVRCDVHIMVDGTLMMIATDSFGPKWSPDGSRVAFTSYDDAFIGDILVANLADGRVANLTNHPAQDWGPAWSRDGRIAFVSDRDGPFEIYVMDGDGANVTRLTVNVGYKHGFAWSPDGSRIAFASDRDGTPELYVMNSDGSNPTRLTYSVGFMWTFAWSPDSSRIAFSCSVESGNRDICAINSGGTSFVRLTTDAADDDGATFSRDGRLAFTTGGEIAVMDGEGTVTRIAPGSEPAWSPEGNRLAFVGTTSSWFGRCYPPCEGCAHNADDFCLPVPDIYVVNLDGTGLSRIASGGIVDWFTPPPGQPVATFTYNCSGSACDFNGSGSLGFNGTLTSYVWQFGDGTSGSGATASHTYSHGDSYIVTLTVTDHTGATGSLSMSVVANASPIASFTVTCVELTCTVDGFASADPDGMITNYSFYFGDGQTGNGPTMIHTYAAAGAFSVTLTVWDDSRYAAMGSQQKVVTVGNTPPIASFTSACHGLTCSFDASGASDREGPIASYIWDFGDATTGSGATANHTYAANGSYTVLLTVTDNAGATSTQAHTVVAASWRAVTRIAYDQCHADLSLWDVQCDIHTLVDGADTVVATGGIGPRWSPDGSKIAFTGNSYFDVNRDDIVVVSLSDRSVVNLTNHPARDAAPAWSRDGGRIAFTSDRTGQFELYVMNADGANVTRLTNGGVSGEQFGWSPDGRVAFVSRLDGEPNLYVVNADGSNLTRLTDHMGFDGQAVWSSDGGRIAFRCAVESAGDWDVCTITSDGTNFVRPPRPPVGEAGRPFGWDPAIAVMGSDGGVSRVDASISGGQPAWSPDGSRLAFVGETPSWYSGTCYFEPGAHNADDFCVAMYDINVVNADGTGLTAIASGGNPDWFIPLPGRPIAAFGYHCSGSTCDFDGSRSLDFDGTIASYAWQFGDGTSGSGERAGHTYSHGSRYIVTLTVTDDAGTTGVSSWMVYANASPVAVFSVECIGPTCTFNSTGSSDADGAITSYYWLFGDGETGGPSILHTTFTHTYATGTFAARLIVRDDAGASSVATHTLSIVNALPVASFTSACSGRTCRFDASATSDSDGSIQSLVWDFGDGSYGRDPVTTHTYLAAGTYIVTLTARDNGRQSSTRSETVNLANAPPVASFTMYCSGLLRCFDAHPSRDPDGTIVSYAWSFGDGTTGSGVMTNRTYATSGTYTVTLIVTDNGGATAQTVAVINANALPLASFTSTCSGLTCSFDARGSSDPDGPIASYAWSFGDGATGSGVTASRTYAAGGTYRVTLIVTDNGGATSETSTIIHPNAPPVAVFIFNCSGLTCNFDASGSSDSDGTVASYAWSYGDGTIGSGVSATRTYATGATYAVTLTVMDNAGVTSQTTGIVNVNAPPLPLFTSACGGLTCSFDATASSDPDGNIASYAWSFGDATTGSGAKVARTYAASGSYPVTLIVTDNGGAKSTLVQGVTVVPPEIHAGDLDGARTIQSTKWTAIVTITIHDSNHGLVANAAVSGSWNDGSTGSCTTNANGQCAVSRSGILKTKTSVSFSVTNVAQATLVYRPADNHDPDSDSNGTTVTVTKQ